MTIDQLIGSLQLGLIYGILGIGLYIPFRILYISDMTTQGSFTLGMVVSGILAYNGMPILGIAVAMLSGALAGVVTGILHTWFRISSILSGILTMTGLYTVNLLVMGGRASISLFGKDTIFTMAGSLGDHPVIPKTLIPMGFAFLVVALVAVFFRTRVGLSIRATGDNEKMVRNSSINTDRMKIYGLALGNAMTALSGAILAQYNDFADVNSGSGILVVGLASIIIGETVFRKNGVTRGVIVTLLGSILYRIIIAMALKFDILPSYALNLISTLIVVVALVTPTAKNSIMRIKQRRLHRAKVRDVLAEHKEMERHIETKEIRRELKEHKKTEKKDQEGRHE